MAQLILTDLGAVRLLKNSVGIERPEPLRIGLYINPHQPSRRDVPTHYVELDGHAYEPKLIAPGTNLWRSVQLDRTMIGVTLPPLIWTFGDGPPVSLYGSFAVGTKSGILYWADPLEEAPVLLQARGQQLEIQPCLASVIAPLVP